MAAVGTVEPADVPGTYLRSVTVTGFRGIGPQTCLELQPGPGLTLVVGRNGSGKSSFAEAAEIALTGTNARWRDRSSVWREGWRNLHRGDAQPSVQVDLYVDGEPGRTRVAREWDSDDVDVSRVWVQRQGARREYGELGWDDALTAYRPFLSYSGLGSVLGRPSGLYDALFRILGLQKVSDAQDRLHGAFTELENRRKEGATQGPTGRRRAGRTARPGRRQVVAAPTTGSRAPTSRLIASSGRGTSISLRRTCSVMCWLLLLGGALARAGAGELGAGSVGHGRAALRPGRLDEDLPVDQVGENA